MVQQAAQFPPEGNGHWAEQRVPVVRMAATDAKGLLAPGNGLSTVPVWVYAWTARVCVPYYVPSTAGDVLAIPRLGDQYSVRITVVLSVLGIVVECAGRPFVFSIVSIHAC